MKKAAIMIVLAIVLPLCLFAENWFTLSHSILGECYTVFWDPASSGAGQTPTSISNQEVDITNLNGAFATLGIVYTGTSNIDIALSFSPLYLFDAENETINTSMTCPYTMKIFNPGTQTDFSEVAERETGTDNKDGLMVSYTKVFLVSHGNTASIGVANNDGRSIADLKAVLDTEEAPAGTFKGYLTCYLTVN